MSLLGRLRILLSGSSETSVVLQVLWCPKRHVQLCQTANTPAIQLQGQRTGVGAQGLGTSFCYNFPTAPLVAPWHLTGVNLLHQQCPLADQPSHNCSMTWCSVLLYWSEEMHRAFVSKWLDGVIAFP